MDDGDELARHDEERAAHAEHAYERSLLVERVLDGRRLDVGPRVDREEDGDGIRRVQATTDLAASSALLARFAGESLCRSTRRARRSATSIRCTARF